MTGTDASRVAEVFGRACDLAGDARQRYLAEACAGDVELRAAVERLLAFDSESIDFLSEREVDLGRRRLERISEEAQQTVRGPDAVRIGPYHILRRLGEGGMGIVYEAEQDSPRRRVALKVVRPTLANSTRLARFRQEAELLGRLQHPGIACVYASGTFDEGHGEQPYFALEMVDGENLTSHVARHRTPVRRRLELLAEVCDAVHHAHDRGVIHRDLKPDNILVDGSGRPKVLDFGVARATEGSTVLTTLVTEDGDLLGTIAYMAPEQVAGRIEAISPRTDVYALGVVAFELLAGRLPHDVVGLPLAAAMRLVLVNDPPRLRELRPELAGDLDTMVGKALEKEPEQRYASAAALAADIRAFLDHRPIAARPPSRTYRALKFARRNRALVGGAGATLLALVLGLVAALVLADRENDQRLAAERSNQMAQVSRRRVLGQLLLTAQERLERGDAWGAALMHREADEDLRDWAWDLQARALPRLLPAVHTSTSWSDASHLRAGWWEQGYQIVDTRGRHRVRSIEPGRPPSALWLPDPVILPGQITARADRTGKPIQQVDMAPPPGTWTRPPARCVTPEGRFIVAAGNNIVAGAHASSRECVVLVDGVERWRLTDVTAVPRITPDGSRVVLYTDQGELWVHDTWSGERLGVIPGFHVADVNRLPIAADSRTAYGILAGFQRMARIDLHTFEVVTLTASITMSEEFAVSPDGRLLATSPSGELTVCDLETGEVVRHEIVFPELGRRSTQAVSFSPDGKQLVVAALQHGAYLVDIDEPPRTGAGLGTADDPRVLVYDDHGHYVYFVAVHPGGRLVASASPAEPAVRVWDLDDGRTLAVLPKGSPPAHGLSRNSLFCFTPDGRSLLMTTVMPDGADTELVAWDLLTGERTRMPPRVPGAERHEQWVGAVVERFGDTGGRLGHTAGRASGQPAWIVFGDRTGETGDRRWRPFGPDIQHQRALAVSPDGARVATADTRTFAVADATTGARRSRIYSPTYGLAYSPDGLLLAAGGVDGRVRLYDAEYDVEVLGFRAHDDYVFSLAWSPVGPRLVTASGDGTVKVWDSRERHVKADDHRTREARLDALRASDDAALLARWSSDGAEARGDVLRVVLERRGL